MRNLAAEALAYLDVAGILQLGKMTREVALGHAGFSQQVKEVCTIHGIEKSNQHEPARFVDEPVDASNGTHGIVHCASTNGMG